VSLELVDDFFDPDDFAVEAIYTNEAGDKTTIYVIFDDAHSSTVAGGVEYENTAPMAKCKTADVSDANHSCTLEIDSVTYKVIETQPDGSGITTLILSKE